ncbi:MAG: MATE family efflux transporter [Anaerovoracaceae bacterium]|nr:MATE family efflux transporter [Bacillota bacterium]
MNRFIGDRQFYKRVLLVAVPIMIQNGITNFVSMLDNIMVGQIGTEPMSGVAIVNQFMFVFFICLIGANAGAGIMGAQYFGSGNNDGVRNAFRFKILSCFAITVVCMLVLVLFGDNLISAFLHEGEGGGNLAETLKYGEEYMKVMYIGMIPFALTQVYSSTLRETGQTVVPMAAGIAAVCVNLFFNYVLIFGKFGAPALGVVGAAAATSLSRFVELALVALWTHRNHEKNPFIVRAYSSFRIPKTVAAHIFRVGVPLLINEVLWALGVALLTQCYSVRGLDVVAAVNISNTLSNVFNVVFISMGNATGIIIGQVLGSGDLKRARDEDTKLISFSVFCCIITGLVMFSLASLFPQIYNTSESVQALAASFIRIVGLCMPVFGFVNAAYFTLRSGGKTLITFLFDSGFMWVFAIPIVFCLSRFTMMPIVPLYLISQLTDLVKCIIGFVLVKRGSWLHNLAVDTGNYQ